MNLRRFQARAGEGNAKKARLLGNEDISIDIAPSVAISREIGCEEEDGGDHLETLLRPKVYFYALAGNKIGVVGGDEINKRVINESGHFHKKSNKKAGKKRTTAEFPLNMEKCHRNNLSSCMHAYGKKITGLDQCRGLLIKVFMTDLECTDEAVLKWLQQIIQSYQFCRSFQTCQRCHRAEQSRLCRMLGTRPSMEVRGHHTHARAFISDTGG